VVREGKNSEKEELGAVRVVRSEAFKSAGNTPDQTVHVGGSASRHAHNPVGAVRDLA
jgi:hypothetical protein